MEMANDVLLAQLLNLGLELKQARAALAAGNTTVEQATEWIFDNSDSIAQQPSPTNSAGTLRLRPDDDMDDVDLQRAIALSTAPQDPAKTPAPPAETKKPPIKINIIRAGQHVPTQSTAPHQPESSSSAAAAAAAVAAPSVDTKRSPPTSSASTKRERESDHTTTSSSSGVTPMLPLISSRQREAEFEAENARLKKEAEQMAEKSKKLKQLEREARQRAIQAIREDRENLKTKQHVPPTTLAESCSSPAASAGSNTAAPAGMATLEPSPARTSAMVQLRLKNGTVLKRSFDNTAPLQQLFDAAIQEEPSLAGEDIRLIQPFPRREFGASEAHQTLQEAGLCPSCSLNVHVPPSTNPVPPPAPDITSPLGSIPGSWQPAPPSFGQIGTDEPEPMDIDEEEEGEEEDQPVGSDEDHSDEEDEDMDGPDNGDDMMHILPVGPGHGHGNPFGGRGRGRGGVLGGRGRGRGGFPFSGAGHRLSSGSGSAGGPSSGGGGSGGDNGGDSSHGNAPAQPVSDAERRQRVLDAMAARAATQQAAAGAATTSSAGTSSSPTEVLSLKAQKTSPAREIASLLSRCSYEVAVLLTSNDSKRAKYLKNLAEVGSQAAELIVQDLIRLKQLDQLTVKRLGRCPVVNLSLDGYSRTTDSLMETLRWTLAPSLSFLSLRGCSLLTDNGFSQLAAFHELEHIDLSHCRCTDANLVHLLELSELRVLILSNTKVTSRGIASTVSKACWKEHLHTLDLSSCDGIQGPSVLIHLQELLNLRNLRLGNTLAFDSGHIMVPDSLGFQRLQELDLMRTRITDDDLQAIRSSFPALEILNLTGCSRLTDVSLQRLCSQGQETIPELTSLKLPDRESPLRDVLPLMADQFCQLSQLDLTGFLNVTDDTLLSLGAATNLTMLSLAGTKLTDVGAPVLAQLELLRELSLDRTLIQDASLDHLRGLGRLEILSLSRCPKLTVDGLKLLAMSASFERTLKRLNLSHNSQIHDEALGYLGQAHALVSLNLDGTDVTTVRARRLADTMENLTQLRIVGVTEGERLEERGVYSIASTILAQNQANQNNNNQNFNL